MCNRNSKRIIIVLFATLVGLLGCQKSESTKAPSVPNTIDQTNVAPEITTPPDSFLNAMVEASYEGAYGCGCNKSTLSQFIDKGVTLPGFWKRINDEQWIYKINKNDPVTDKTTSISLLFTQKDLPTGACKDGTTKLAILDRVVVNDVDSNNHEVYDFWLKICEKLERK
jgi:hypothetical protein